MSYCGKCAACNCQDQDVFNFYAKIVASGYIISGAIIGDGDRKRASFLVLGLAP